MITSNVVKVLELRSFILQSNEDLPKVYLTFPKPFQKVARIKRLGHVLLGLFLFPLYWGISYVLKTPGLVFRRYCFMKGFRLLFLDKDIRQAYNFIVSPMDSVRYFEFDFMWSSIKKINVNKYLDVSSPRLLPLMIVDKNKNLVADLINPDKKDLPITINLAESFGVVERCRFYPTLIEDASLKLNSFDVITSMSVVEHIPNDKDAIQKMWDLLKPGGMLLISVPCAAKASEEYINLNDYELIDTDENGFVFWQRYYDENLIRQQIYSVTGEPNRFQIYGEKSVNLYHQNVVQKRSNPYYPYWREPFMMGLEYEFKGDLSDLPGVGVIGMEFIKPN